MNAGRIEEQMSVDRDGLQNDTLPFWMDHCMDHYHGGYILSHGRDGTALRGEEVRLEASFASMGTEPG